MKKYFIALFGALIFGPVVWAANVQKQIEVKDGQWGKFDLKVTLDGDKPMLESLTMDLSLLCRDQRKHGNSAVPASDPLLNGEKICSVDRFSFDKEKKVLTLGFATVSNSSGEAECDEHWEQDFDIRELCSGWAVGSAQSAQISRQPASEIADTGETDTLSARAKRKGVSSRRKVKYDNRPAETEDSGFFGPGFMPSYGTTSPTSKHTKLRKGEKRCPELESLISQYTSEVRCYSSLFRVEGGCSTTVIHDRVKTHNPNAGIGLCALEKSPAIRARNGRGPECAQISTTSEQIRCCIHLMQKWGASYFGTVQAGLTPRCH